MVCGYKDTQNLDERNDLREKLVGKVLFFNNGRKAHDRTFAPVK